MDKQVWAKLDHPNQFIYSVTNITTVNYICKEYTKTCIIQGAGLINVPPLARVFIEVQYFNLTTNYRMLCSFYDDLKGTFLVCTHYLVQYVLFEYNKFNLTLKLLDIP